MKSKGLYLTMRLPLSLLQKRPQNCLPVNIQRAKFLPKQLSKK
jgi:hypothetical protein